jgi:hypothetical protein
VGGIPEQAYRFIDVDGGNVTDNILQLQNIKVVLSVIYHVTHQGNKIIANHKCSNMSQVEN